MENFMQMMSSMPPEALQSILSGAGSHPYVYVCMYVWNGSLRPAGGGAGMGRAAAAGQSNVIHLTHDEMEAVNRLVALGFSQQQVRSHYQYPIHTYIHTYIRHIKSM